ncbi:polysaccharide deacetylase family protein [Zobellia galactanivorans]|uniref:polysaccharide deacetylase family protein n=1 Tax=Zobellia galactanivorans (strain DSM 12802 / CCUG 47099 / CIP 106680 / NCIMB 13871 / Dsij) TaxID=63186 RepID=UPI001C06B422|nr:polysaccharide deacetylase family protein [Zobellia galactanivorans]MBU3024275.1 polysaccharide deacetylase family protein [Zobellia galactanivorans]MDO6809650.1 polysaccharide deacetylase family protein [Zobellia galactanivorans]
MHFKLLLSLLITMGFQSLVAQENKLWNTKKCAVVLTYDDALNEHLDNVIPALDEHGLRATFYLIGESETLNKRLDEWRSAAQNGHELGNHSLTHPCINKPGRKKPLSPEKDLANFTLDRVVNEIKITNTLLHSIDGKTERTFAYPCGHMKIDSVLFFPYLKGEFIAARGVKRNMMTAGQIDLDDINCFGMKGHTGQEMKQLVDQAIESNTLLVFLFHGVGGGSPLNVSVEAHQELIAYLREKQDEIWIAPLVEVAKYIKTRTPQNKPKTIEKNK